MIMSPTVYVVKNLKFKIHFRDHNPPHIHVQGKGAEAVFLLNSGECIENKGFSAKTINQLGNLVREKTKIFLEAWDEYQK